MTLIRVGIVVTQYLVNSKDNEITLLGVEILKRLFRLEGISMMMWLETGEFLIALFLIIRPSNRHDNLDNEGRQSVDQLTILESDIESMHLTLNRPATR